MPVALGACASSQKAVGVVYDLRDRYLILAEVFGEMNTMRADADIRRGAQRGWRCAPVGASGPEVDW